MIGGYWSWQWLCPHEWVDTVMGGKSPYKRADFHISSTTCLSLREGIVTRLLACLV